LARLHTKFQTLENDLDLDREHQQLGVFLVLHNQDNTSNINQGDEGFIRIYKDMENHLSGVCCSTEALSAKLQQLEASAVEEEMGHSGPTEYIAQKGYHQ
jgi:predicted RNA-binding protein (virulence factor B family)